MSMELAYLVVYIVEICTCHIMENTSNLVSDMFASGPVMNDSFFPKDRKELPEKLNLPVICFLFHPEECQRVGNRYMKKECMLENFK